MAKNRDGTERHKKTKKNKLKIVSIGKVRFNQKNQKKIIYFLENAGLLAKNAQWD